MILKPVADLTAYRMHTPKWAMAPTSGAGAAAAGGRANRIGVAALYLWVLGDEAIAAGAKGILFSSRVRPGGTNLVIYTEVLGTGGAIDVYDPENALPRNQQSWLPEK